ncbi:hypothetical protein QYF36_021739 [Acer negundo]|nr:hypothetical protein QYF36_021739 [Acer negundo]
MKQARTSCGADGGRIYGDSASSGAKTKPVTVNVILKAKDETVAYINKEKPPIKMYGRLLNLASSALVEKEFKQEKSNFWEEPYQQESVWNTCADRRTPNLDMQGNLDKSNGYILVCANGGLNQQRIAQAGALLLRRIRKYDSKCSMLDKQLSETSNPIFPLNNKTLQEVYQAIWLYT